MSPDHYQAFIPVNRAWEMAINTVFEFGDLRESSSAQVHVARIPAGLTDTHGLMVALRNGLGLPSYFGFNWNALSDCLRDLHWLEQRTVVLAHEDLPRLPAPDLAVYLNVLDEAVKSWAPEEDHSLRVLFPADASADVLRAATGPQ